MIYLAYCSAATALMSNADLIALLRTSRKNNEALGITGMLLYHEGSFMQVLEGEKEAVQSTYRKILIDRRHHNLIKMLDGPIEQRSFREWSMGFVGSDDLTEDDRSAYTHFMDAPTDSEPAASGRALKLLQSFRRLAR
jgi:hypothetical protein